MSNRLRNIRDVPAVGALTERETGGFLLVAALVGVGVGIGAAALVLTLEAISHLTETESHILVFAFIPAGFLAAWWIARRFAPEVSGDGVPAATEALLVHGGHIRGRVAPLKVLATSLTVGAGGSAGREGPIVQIGAAIGSWFSRRFNMGEDQVRSLVAAGAGAGIGASFNAPIAGMLFALEVILVSFAPRHMSAVVIASVTAAITSQSLVGEELALNAGSYSLGHPSELLFYAGLGLVIVAFGFVFLRLLDGIEGVAHRHGHRLGFVRPLLAGLVVALLVFIEPGLGGTGQSVTNALLLEQQNFSITGSGGDVWWLLLALAAGKALATSLTISSGGSGGAFMPSLFMGAAVGTGFARLVQDLTPVELESGAFAVVGMAAMFAVVGRAPLTAILIVFEVTGARDYGLILPLMLTATLATFLGERFHRDSVYTMALRRKGVPLTRASEVDLLDTVSVGSVIQSLPFVAAPWWTLEELDGRLRSERMHGVPVVDDGVLVGIVTVSDMGRASSHPETATVKEVMTPKPVTVSPSTPVSMALERMSALGVGRLPVVAEDEPDRLVGLFRREEAVTAYHRALSTSTEHNLQRMRLAQRTVPGAGYFDFRVPPGSVADRRKVSEVAWPEGLTLVSVRRDREVLIPGGTTTLLSGDVVTAFGSEGSKRRLIDRLNAGADEPTAEVFLEDLMVEDDPDFGSETEAG